ncbi:MAG: TrbI/VirB10 family protein [Acidobacteriia bacterium]|nr:TrbI/VirB10 family protein [Terriglobia bacterium]
MFRSSFAVAIALACCAVIPLRAADPGRDFSGKWVLDPQASNLRALSAQPDPFLEVTQDDDAIHCAATAADGAIWRWSYALDRSERKYHVRNETMNSVAKWEGAALLVNTLVSGPRDYTVMDRWRLSGDRTVLKVERHVMNGTAELEGLLVYRREGQTAAAAPAAANEPQSLARRAAPPATARITVPAGTHIPMVLLNAVDTKHSHEGDRIYLKTSVPIALDGRIVIPRGSSVTGTVAEAKQAGRVKGKGELFLRFDSLTLPNGVTRDLRSRVGSSDGAGTVDRKEGKIGGESDPKGDATKVAIGTGAGTAAGHVAGHTGMGAGLGAAAGLAAVLFSRGPGVVLPKGTSVEMILDRDLFFSGEELR